MAIVTINSSTTYSAIKGSLASGDTIRIGTDAVRLTVDEQPLLTGIIVDSPARSGRMTVSAAYDLSTWAVIAGTVALIDGTFPAGATLGSATAGSAGNAHGVATNAGTVIAAIGSPTTNAAGVSTNNATVTTATGGGANAAHGVASNFGTIEAATGGTAAGAHGCNINSATVGTSTGGTVANAFGTNTNNGTVTTSNGSGSGIGTNLTTGLVLRAFDGVSLAIGTLRGGPKLIIGPDFQAAVSSYVSVARIYSIGEVSPLANIPLATEIVILSEGSGGGFPLSRVLN